MRAVGRRNVARHAAMLASWLLVVLVGAGSFGAATNPVHAVDVLPPWQVPCPAADSAGPLPAGAHSLSGVVTNASSEGVSGIRIYVSQLVGGQQVGRESTTTGSGGSWSLDGLGDATYVVGYYDDAETYRNGWYSSTGLVIGTENSTPITVAGASVGSIDVELPVEAPLVLSGTIVDQAADPVSGIRVTATDVDFPFTGCANSDNAGWQMRVRTGRYVVHVQDFSGTYPNGFYDALNTATGFTLAHGEASLLDLTGDTAGIDITYPPTHTIQGTVTDGAIPLDGISVSGCVDDFQTCTTFANTIDGAFTLPNVVDGDWALRIGDGSGTYRSGYRGTGGGVVPAAAGAEVTTVSGADVTGVAITTFKNATVSGTVTDSALAALAGIDVSVCDVNQEFCASATTTGSGYTTGGLPPNDYLVTLTDPSGDHPSGYLAIGGGITYDVGDALVLGVGDVDLVDVDAEIPNGYRIAGTLTVNGTLAESGQVSACLEEFLCVGEGNVEIGGSFQTPALLPGMYFLGTFGQSDRFFFVDGAPATTVFDDATAVPVVSDPVSGIVFRVTETPPGADTPEGANVEVFPEDPDTGHAPVQLTFDDVTIAGETWLTISDDGPAIPGGFQLGDPPAWYDIETSATFVGNVEICITYNGGAFADEANLKLLHYDDEAEPPEWDDVTTSLEVDNDRICGLTDGFSPFVVARPSHTFGGFEAPVDDRPELNRAKAGSSIPVAFDLGGDFGLAIFAEGFPKSGITSCTPVTPDQIESTSPAGKSKLSYDPVTGLYTYIWKTEKSWANTCRTLRLVFADGTEAEADFTFVR